MLSKVQNEYYVFVLRPTGIDLNHKGQTIWKLRLEQYQHCERIIKKWMQLLIVCKKTGAHINLSHLLNEFPKRARYIVVSEIVWTRTALLAALTRNMKDGKRVELIALRIDSMTDEEVTYWYSRVAHFPKPMRDWASKGMRIMLAGDGSDKEEIEEMLDDLRNKA